ncbi:hypothetical protein CLIB1423_01S08174 [[Candida] railenensis]|uniref:Uncharacterized protein n=1 Tax=[Candida] railenensis TaxID=45579 RepID=A0A9P0VWD4_9ASCO|nr:hypothetical protein CLIB1423_01S08174 [[Candida] railenensis]
MAVFCLSCAIISSLCLSKFAPLSRCPSIRPTATVDSKIATVAAIALGVCRFLMYEKSTFHATSAAISVDVCRFLMYDIHTFTVTLTNAEINNKISGVKVDCVTSVAIMNAITKTHENRLRSSASFTNMTGMDAKEELTKKATAALAMNERGLLFCFFSIICICPISPSYNPFSTSFQIF